MKVSNMICVRNFPHEKVSVKVAKLAQWNLGFFVDCQLQM